MVLSLPLFTLLSRHENPVKIGLSREDKATAGTFLCGDSFGQYRACFFFWPCPVQLAGLTMASSSTAPMVQCHVFDSFGLDKAGSTETVFDFLPKWL